MKKNCNSRKRVRNEGNRRETNVDENQKYEYMEESDNIHARAASTPILTWWARGKFLPQQRTYLRL
jgi:hypothetical protein